MIQYLVNKVIGVTADCAPIESPFKIFDSEMALYVWLNTIEEKEKKNFIAYEFKDGNNPKMYTFKF